MKVALAIALSALLVVAYCAQMARWLRVLQREHYDPTSLLRFLARWSSPQRPSAKANQGAKPRRPFTLSHLLIFAMIATVAFRLWDLLVVVVAGLNDAVTSYGRVPMVSFTAPLKPLRLLTAIVVVPLVLRTIER